MTRFNGKTAIVTGANTGIGLETARMLALKGADVALRCLAALPDDRASLVVVGGPSGVDGHEIEDARRTHPVRPEAARARRGARLQHHFGR